MWGIILTMAFQVGTSIFNLRYNRKTTDALKQMQREFRRESQARYLSRDSERFKNSCAFQLEMEEKSHEERLAAIDNDFISSLERWSHSEALTSHYPLKISPYIVKKSVVPVFGTQLDNSRKEVFCLLTGSNNALFNREVLPLLDEQLCEVISVCWNQQSTHTMCYYSDVWRKNELYCPEKIDNLKTIIKTPTIAITPYFEERNGSNELVVKINMWGIGNENCISSQIKTGCVFEKLPSKYSPEKIGEVVDAIFKSSVCALGQIVDVYYWTNYYQTPVFPSLVSRGEIVLDKNSLSQMACTYSALYENLVLGKSAEESESQTAVRDIAEINLCNFPERSVGFLDSLSRISKFGVDIEKLVLNTMLSLYKARTDHDVVNLKDIDVRYLGWEEVEFVSKMIQIAKKSSPVSIDTALLDIIEKRIRIWN